MEDDDDDDDFFKKKPLPKVPTSENKKTEEKPKAI